MPCISVQSQAAVLLWRFTNAVKKRNLSSGSASDGIKCCYSCAHESEPLSLYINYNQIREQKTRSTRKPFDWSICILCQQTKSQGVRKLCFQDRCSQGQRKCHRKPHKFSSRPYCSSWCDIP